MKGKKKVKEPAGMNIPEIFAALAMLEKERGIPQSFMMGKIIQALTAAYKKDHEGVENVIVDVNEEKKDLRMYVQKEIVEEVENPGSQISLEEAKRLSAKNELGGIVNIPVESVEFGRIAAGNGKLMEELGVAWHECHSVGTIIHMSIDGKYAGHIVISDVIKPHSKEAIQKLKHAGVEKTVMLTGDAKRVADQVAKELGIDEVRSELLPGDKVNEVEKLIQNKPKKANLAFVGDGINDAPVLTRADIGIAMGAMGSDAAIEAADVVLMDDDPMQIAKAIKISRKCIGIVYQNIVFALAIKFACLVLGALGLASMWTAIFADVGVMVLAVLNATRALYTKDLAKKNEQ